MAVQPAAQVQVERPPVQSWGGVAIIQGRTLKTEVGKGSV